MFIWTKENVATVTAQWAEGLSAAQIAGGFGRGLTRSAVLGKIHRLGLIKPVKQVTHSVLRIRRARDRSAALKQPSALRPAPVLSPVPVAGTPPAKPAVITCDHMVRLMQLTDKTCRYPLWRDDTPFNEQWFCGTPTADVLDSKPYCHGHHRIAFDKPRGHPRKVGSAWMEAAE